MSAPLWTPGPEEIEAANLTRFMAAARERGDLAIPDFKALYEWSVAECERFWDLVWDFCGVVAETKGERILIDGDKMPGAKFFPDAKLNFAENLLRRSGPETAIAFWGEDAVKRTMSFDELTALVSRLQQALGDAGVGPGDRVAGWMPNLPETVAAMLATVSLGAVWSSSSPDFGVKGIVDRFGQIDAKVLFLPDGYYYNGKSHDCLERAKRIVAQLPTLRRVVVTPYIDDRNDVEQRSDVAELPNAALFDDFIAPFEAGPVRYARMPFNHPLYIMFSSGTTGAPKCILHGAGGTLLQHLKEHVLHTNVRRGDRVFYFTTCGWMMWNWLVSALAAQGSVMLYDGSPFHPSGNILFDFADAAGMTVFGTSAKYIDALNKAGIEPKRTHDLRTVRTMCSTGSPLAPEGFDYVYRSVKSDICLSSISGGADIVSCFALGNPIGPVRRGELQTRGLGMAVEVFDDNARPIRGAKGELVCVKPFPSMPIGFWNDDDGAKYRSAYFDEYPNVWRHGDYVELTEHDGMIVYGRSDATLNPGGVRIGTAEIYRQVEQMDEVEEGLVIGQDWDRDVRVVLFVRLREGLILDEDLIEKIKTRIRRNTTPRHVPAKLLQVADIPRTKSGKIVELAVRNLVHDRPVKNIEALANPEALEHFRARTELSRP